MPPLILKNTVRNGAEPFIVRRLALSLTAAPSLMTVQAKPQFHLMFADVFTRRRSKH